VEMWLEKISTGKLVVRESFVPIWESPAVAGVSPLPLGLVKSSTYGEMSDKIFCHSKLGAKSCGQRS
jgi:hypothetical protein